MILPIILCLPLGAWTFAVLGQRSQNFITGGAPVMLILLNVGLALVAYMIYLTVRSRTAEQ